MPNIEDPSLFSKQKINFHPSSTIVQFAACNNVIIVCTDNGKLLRIPLQEQEKQTEIDATTAADRFEHIHLDPTGQHLLISLSSGEVLYFHPTMKRPKPLTKIKGNIITTVAWNAEYSKDNTTGFILVGTSRGLLFETEILQTGAVSYFHQVWCLTEDVTRPSSVTGVFMHRCGTDGKRWMVFITTAGQLFPFAGNIGNPADGGSVMQNVFQSGTESGRSLSLMTPSSAVGDKQKRFASQLHLYPPWADSVLSYVAWLEAPGIQHGGIDQAQVDPYKMFTNQKLYCYPVVNGVCERPLGIVLTEYHILILYEDRVNAMCTMNEQIVYEDLLGKKFGKLVGITRDPISGIIWVFTSNSVLRYKTNDETKHLWSIFLEMGDYIQARKFAASNSHNLDVVLRRQASKLYDEKNYSAAAEMFALTQAPFEEISLKFIQADDRGSLKIYLQKKLDSLDLLEKTKKCVLIVWLLEIFLAELGDARVGTPGQIKHGADGGVLKDDGHSPAVAAQRYKLARQQFAVFLKRDDVKECMEVNHDAVVRMMSNHGDMESLLYFSELSKDYDTVVLLCIQQQNYDEALAVLGKQANAKLFYKFSPDLMPHLPAKLVDSWINAGMLLRPVHLIPALYRCQDERLAREAIRYLEHSISKADINDVSVHNLLIALYVNYGTPERLMRYLESQGQDGSMVKYDLKYALRLCLSKNLHNAAVHVYCTMGLFEEAVSLALKVNIDLAKHCASLPNENYELKRKLWLCVARHVVAKEQDIKRSMDLLQESDGLIKIQDLLPFFPDFVTIDHFKDSLCDCLMERSGKIQSLQEEMKEATDVAEQIKKQIKVSKNKYSIVRSQDKCSSCNAALISRGFYCFPCRHNFHVDCLENECSTLMSGEQKQRIRQLRRQLANVQQVAASSTVDSESTNSQARQSALFGDQMEKNPQCELDDLLAGECPFCGSLTISAVDRLFFTPQEYLQEQKNWD